MKSKPFTIEDLEKKGFKANDSGEFTWNPIKPKSNIKKINPTKEKPVGLAEIERILNHLSIDFINEYKFCEKRKFRFDIAILDRKIGTEYEGLISKKSRHTTVLGFTKDTEKYNLALTEGWRVLRYTALNYKNFVEDIKKLI